MLADTRLKVNGEHDPDLEWSEPMARKNKKQTEPATTTTTAAPVAIETQPAPAPQTTQPTETKPVRNNIKPAKSTVANPVQVVHQLVAEMVKANPQVRRRDLVDAAVKAGCAYYTARTQVQIALKKMKTVTTS